MFIYIYLHLLANFRRMCQDKIEVNRSPGMSWVFRSIGASGDCVEVQFGGEFWCNYLDLAKDGG